MKKSTLFLGALLGMFVFNACDNEIPEPTNNKQQEGAHDHFFTVKDYDWEDEEEESRTNVTPNGVFTWAAGDTIGILPQEGSQIYFAINPEDAGKDKASFNGGAWGLKPGSEYAAYYPFVQDIMLDRTKVPVDFTGQVIAGKTTAKLGNFDYMAAKPTPTNDLGGVAWSFNHLGVMCRLTFSVPTPGEVSQIILTCPQPVFPVKGFIDLTQENIGISYTQEDLSRSFHVRVEDLVTTEENEEVTVYFMMAPVDLTGVAHALSMTVTYGEEKTNAQYSLSINKPNLVAQTGRIFTATPDPNYIPDYYQLSWGFTTSTLKTAFEEYGGTKLKFMPNSSVTGDRQLGYYNAPLYAVRNGEWLELHTRAKEFRVSGSFQFSSYDYFKYALLTEIDLNGVNTENVTSMYNMFRRLSLLEKIHFGSKFNTSKVQDMEQMFAECESLTSLDLSGFDTQNVKYMQNMFYQCKALKSVDLSSFNTENVLQMYQMFYQCNALESLDLSSFNTEKITNLGAMFAQCNSLVSVDLSSFNTENAQQMYQMFYQCNALESLDLSSFNTAAVTDMNNMFSGCQSLKSLDLSNFNTENVQYMYSMFNNCSALESLDISNFNTGKITDASSMFYNCSSLKTLDLSSFNTEGVVYMSNMFNGCQSLESLDLSSFNTEKVEYMQYMFQNCRSLKTLDLSSFNTEALRQMSSMFNGCESLESLDLSNFNTAAVLNMSNLFRSCTSLKSLDLSSFNTAAINNMSYMFADCQSLESLDLSSFNTENVTSMAHMFMNCIALTSVDLSSFNTSKVTSMYNMFKNCRSLESLDLSNFDTANVTDFEGTFMNCESLTSLDISSFNTEKNTWFARMFSGCKSLPSLDLSNFVFTNGQVWDQMFTDTGASCSEKPISIFVTEEGKAILESKNTNINSEYAELVVKTGFWE